MRVPMFETFGWDCEWNPERGTHTFTRPGDKTIVVRSNAAWKLGMPPVSADRSLLPRFWCVERTRAARLLPVNLKGFGNLTDGGEQGGGSIALHPQFYGRETLDEADRTMERHPIAAFHWDTGRPLTRADYGYAEPYYLDQRSVYDADPFTQLHPFRAIPSVGVREAFWKRIDGAHLIRAFGRDVACWEAVRDPVARMRLIVQAFDVLASFPLNYLDGEPGTFRGSFGCMRLNVAMYPHLAKLGTVRWLAWCIRAVAEAYKVCPHRELRAWLVCAVEIIEIGQAANGTFGDFYHGEGQIQEQPWEVQQPGYEKLPEQDGAVASWECCFMVRAITEAAKALRNPDSTTRARAIVTRFLGMMRSLPKCKSRYNSYPGMGYWPITSRNRVLVPRVVDWIGDSNSQYEPDVWACAVELGVEERIDPFYDRITTLEDSAAVVALQQ